MQILRTSAKNVHFVRLPRFWRNVEECPWTMFRHIRPISSGMHANHDDDDDDDENYDEEEDDYDEYDDDGEVEEEEEDG